MHEYFHINVEAILPNNGNHNRPQKRGLDSLTLTCVGDVIKNQMKPANLYPKFYQQILRYLSRFVNETDAQDLAQEVFIKVNVNLDKFKGKSSIKTWIYKIATNIVKDYLKSKSYQLSKKHISISEIDLEGYDGFVSPAVLSEDKLDANEMNKCIKEFILRIPVNYSSILVLCDLEGLNTKEVSKILGLSTDAVKVRLHRARAKLKDELVSGCMITATCDNKILCERKNNY